MTRAHASTALRVLLVLVLTAAAVVGGYAVTQTVRTANAAKPLKAGPTPPAVLGSAAARPTAISGGASSTATEPTAAGISAQLKQVVSAPGLGSRLRLRIVDAATGTVLDDAGGTAPAAPASTAKLLTAAAVLTVHRPTDRITTAVRRGPDGSIVLVGGGDPTLTGAAAGKPGAYPYAARLSSLAAAVRAAGIRPTRVLVDDRLFSGPSISPSWAPSDVPSDYGAAITALMADGGRATPASVDRSASPDLDAGHEFASLLGAPSLSVARLTSTEPLGAVVGTVQSATYAELIEQMLLASDNVIAECLARQVALSEHQPATFLGGAAAIRDVLSAAGVDPGDGMVDGSGLAARDRLSVATLASVLQLILRTPRLRSIVALMPVAAWSGTLAARYVGTSAAGVVRAKTGTLTGVSSLAGLVHDRSGRLLIVAMDADRTTSTPAAESALDAIVERLVGCGCGA